MGDRRSGVFRAERLAAVLFLLLLAAGCEDSGQLDVARRFLERLNEHDVTGAAQALAEDAVVRVAGHPPIAAPADIRGWLEWDSVVGRHIDARGLDVRGDTIDLGRVTVRDRGLALLGVPSLDLERGSRIVVASGRVREVVLAPLDTASRAVWERRLAEFYPWAQHEFPLRLQRVLPAGQYALGARRAADWLELLRQWLSSGS